MNATRPGGIPGPSGPDVQPALAATATKADWKGLPGLARARAERDAVFRCLETPAHDAGCGCDDCVQLPICPHCRRRECRSADRLSMPQTSIEPQAGGLR